MCLVGLECWDLWWAKGGSYPRGHEEYEGAYWCNTVSGRWPSELREQREHVAVQFRSGVMAGPGVDVYSTVP